MNKTKKLLSVVLAIVMALSCMSIMASAVKTNYRTVDELTALNAYSPYGQVTRLSTEERTSIVMDALDNILAKANINMGTLIDVLGLKVTINLTSVDNICASFDTIKDTFNNTLFGIAKAIVNLGILENVEVDTWQTGMSRHGTANFTILSELVEVISAQSGIIYDVVSTGSLDLGLIGGALGDISSVTDLIGNIPGLLKGLILPLVERWDDTLEIVQKYDTAIDTRDGGVEELVNFRLKKLFTDDMSNTTVKYDVNGNMTSKHTKMPIVTSVPSKDVQTVASTPRMVYYVNGTTPGSIMTIYHLVDAAEAKALAKTPDKVNGSPAAYTYFQEEQQYQLAQEIEGSDTYVWKAIDSTTNEIIKEGGWTLKWYDDDSQLLPGAPEINLSTMSAGELLYKFIPVVFENMAPVVLNGSVKKILAEFFGAKFTYVGEGGPEADEAVLALPDASNAFFTEEKGDYIFNEQWSNYAVINGTHYYRFENQIFAADLSATDNYFDIINWDYKITGDFMNDFIPANDDNVNDRLLLNVNDFLIEVATTITKDSVLTEDSISGKEAQWTRPTFTSGNANLVENLKKAAQAVISLAPEHIFGSNFAENQRCYYEVMMSSNDDEVLVGIAATLVDALMPSMTLPGKDDILGSGAKVGAILAAVVREFAAYLAPEYNFDALIYTSFENGTKKFVSGNGIDSNYWFDVILTMGINVGFEYLRAFADMGEDSNEWNAFVAYSGYAPDGKTYTAMTTDELNAHWEGMLDYVIDWALDDGYVTETHIKETVIPGNTTDCDDTNDEDTIQKEEVTETYLKNEWTWKMENIVDVSGLTIDLGSAQDPFVKIQQILGKILPVDEILTVEPTNGETKFEHWLRYDLILGIVDLEWDHLINTIQFNGTNQYFREVNVLDNLAKIVKGIVNSLFAKVGNSSDNYKLIPDAISDFDTLANQGNIATLARDLVAALYNALITDKLAETALPILNFFLGWKTDPQQIADPQLWTSFRDGNDYAYLWKDGGFGAGSSIGDGATVIKLLNNSAGMLETHRNSTVTDHAYDIQIKSVTSDADVNTLSFTYGDGNGLVSPYETLDIIVGGTYQGDEAVTVTIAYDYVGKDGQAIGGTQYTSISFYISNLYEDANIDGRFSGDDDEDYTGIDQYKKYVFTKDIYTSVTEYKPKIFYVEPTIALSKPAKSFQYISAPNGSIDMTGKAATYFDYITDQDEAGWLDSINKDDPTSTSGYLYKAASGVTAETFSEENSIENNLYGTYDMGQIAVKYGSGEKTWNIDFIYYNDYNIGDIYTANKDNGYTAYDGVDAELYNRYNEAWKLIVLGATYPMMTEANGNASVDYVATIQPYIPAAIEEFEAAKEAYEEALAEAQASGAATGNLPAYIQTMTEEIENDFIDGKEINFQDYSFYEYFNYNDVKVAAENLYRTYLVPEIMDEYYILNSGIREAELNNVIAAEENEYKAAGITASRLKNDQAAIDASIAAHDAWVAPVTTKLVADDFTSRLAFYKQFLEVNKEPLSYNGKAAHLYFLEKEIAFVEAQGLDSADYESVSWERYADALAEAKAVAAGSDEFSAFNSRIYDVKYNLMVAYKQLLLKDDSLIEAGGTAALEANITIAEEIFATYGTEDGYALAADYTGTEDEAFAALISALGYYYVGEDGNTWNLYADSALEYADNDRPNNSGNQAKVNAANANLVAALANFEIAAAPLEPNTLVLNENAPFEAIIDLDNTIGGEYTGTVYGFDTLGYNDNWEVDGTIADFLSTAYGDDYLEVVVGDAGVETTGTVINVLDDNGDVVESYMFVYFGDMDMDGAVGLADSAMAEDYEMLFEGIDSLATFMAGDLDSDSMPGLSDSATMFDWEMLAEGMPLQADIGPNASGIVYEIF